MHELHLDHGNHIGSAFHNIFTFDRLEGDNKEHETEGNERVFRRC